MNAETDTPIRRARRGLGLSQKDAACAVGADQGGWSRIERGQQAPSPEMTFRIASLLGLTVEEVLSPFRPSETESPTKEAA